MEKLLDKTSYGKYLLSIPAVGVISASAFLGEIRTLYRYKVDIKKTEKTKALTAIAAKMIRLMFTLCKKREYYSPEEIKRYWFSKGGERPEDVRG